MLRRRHHPQAQAARQAEGGKEEDAQLWARRNPSGGLHRRAQDGRRLVPNFRILQSDEPERGSRVLGAWYLCHSCRRGLPMRSAAILFLIFLAVHLSSAQATPASIEGSWRGSGIVTYRNGADNVQ